MTREEAIRFANYAQCMAKLQDVKEFYALAEAALREQEERRWIPVTERLPSKSGRYVVIDGKYESVLNYSSRHQRFNAFDDLDPEYVERHAIMPTHWMPLPKPPKGE